MSGLIKASLLKIMKSKAFLFSVIFQIGFALFAIIPTGGSGFSIGGNFLFADSLISMFLSTFSVHFFLHADYHEGMARNKIITGHTRGKIYFANCISTITASWVIFLTPVIVSFALALPMGVVLGVTWSEFALRITALLAANAAMCGIFVLAAFLFRNMGAAVSAAVALAMFFVSVICMLNADYPEDAAEIFEAVGIEQFDPSSALNNILLDILPTSHMVRAMVSDTNGFTAGLTAFLPIYSILVTAAAVICGIILFRRKDLK